MDLQAIRFGRTEDRPHVLFTGGVHGDEYEPMAALRRLADELSGRRLKGRVTIIPVVNEEAFRRCSRTAGDGLDLARTFPGRPDGAITERVAAAAAEIIRSADFYIDLHTGGERLQVHPLAGYMMHQDSGVLAAQRRLARAFGLPIVWGTTPALEGRSLSVARDANVPAIYTEYLGGGCDPRGVQAYLEGCLNVLIDLGLVEGLIRELGVDPLIVEDSRPGSGYMQVQNPSPCDGFFEAWTSLGERICAGQPLGVVSDSLGKVRIPVKSDRGGIVLVLRRLPRIEKNECVGVVLETAAAPPTQES